MLVSCFLETEHELEASEVRDEDKTDENPDRGKLIGKLLVDWLLLLMTLEFGTFICCCMYSFKGNTN
jgi:hypothetical protein